jgi:predicted RNA-binding protein Jag
MYQDGMEGQVQRLADSHGPGKVRRWADEGMTLDTMGKPQQMEAFRERQRQRSPEIPWNIERQNAKSVQRSKDAHLDSPKAGDTQVPGSVRDVIASPGQQLDDGIQQAIEERMGDSLGDVRIHTGPAAAQACTDINARAFTVGNHIAFNTGEYDPSSPEGQHVLVHELAHVRQQTGGAVSMLPDTGEFRIDPDERLEREAEKTAQRVMQGGALGVHRMRSSEVHVQRLSADEYIGGHSIEEMIEAIASESDLSSAEIESIVENYKDSGTVHSGAKGHDALNLKALKEAQDLLESADLMAGIDEDLLAELEDGNLQVDMAIAGMKETQGQSNAAGLDLFDSPEEASEAVEQVKADKETLEQRTEQLEQRLEATIGGTNVRLTDAQAEQLEQIADQIDSPYTEYAVEILLNYLSVETTGVTLSGAIATAVNTSQMGGVVVAMGVVSTVATILPHAISLLEESFMSDSTADDIGDGDSQADELGK